MELHEQLDALLRIYYNRFIQGKNNILSKEYEFMHICEVNFNVTDPAKMAILYNKVIGDQYISVLETKATKDVTITKEGIRFLNEGGYKRQYDDIVRLEWKENQEGIIREKTINKFTWDILSIFISLLALVISIYSLFK